MRLEGHIISLSVLMIFIVNTLYALYSPDIPTIQYPKYYTFWAIIYFISQYLFMFLLCLVLLKRVNSSEESFAIISMMIYLIGMTIYEICITQNYIPSLNSRVSCFGVSIFLWLMAFLYGLFTNTFINAFKSLKRWVKCLENQS
jgi:hypothetical protein